MELILWRHADAEMTAPDLGRELTEVGRKQAARVAGWLTPRLPPDIRILASPAARAIQTAQALGRTYEVIDALAPGASAELVLGAAGWPDADYPVMIVGHQPTLGQIASRLLCGQARELTVKKGGIWWFQGRGRADELHVVLRAVAAPDWL
ncbi:MAG: histidine phosphatase family protein [Thiobacillus sp.]|nr:histidine phosphatase family protein [Thiobacillus sp.]